MKKRILTGLALIIVLVSGGIFIYHKLTKPDLGPKTTKLYQHGFQLLEDQIGTYIKEHYTGMRRLFQLFMIDKEIKEYSVVSIKIFIIQLMVL